MYGRLRRALSPEKDEDCSRWLRLRCLQVSSCRSLCDGQSIGLHGPYYGHYLGYPLSLNCNGQGAPPMCRSNGHRIGYQCSCALLDRPMDRRDDLPRRQRCGRAECGVQVARYGHIASLHFLAVVQCAQRSDNCGILLSSTCGSELTELQGGMVYTRSQTQPAQICLTTMDQMYFPKSRYAVNPSR